MDTSLIDLDVQPWCAQCTQYLSLCVRRAALFSALTVRLPISRDRLGTGPTTVDCTMFGARRYVRATAKNKVLQLVLPVLWLSLPLSLPSQLCSLGSPVGRVPYNTLLPPARCAISALPLSTQRRTARVRRVACVVRCSTTNEHRIGAQYVRSCAYHGLGLARSTIVGSATDAVAACALRTAGGDDARLGVGAALADHRRTAADVPIGRRQRHQGWCQPQLYSTCGTLQSRSRSQVKAIHDCCGHVASHSCHSGTSVRSTHTATARTHPTARAHPLL